MPILLFLLWPLVEIAGFAWIGGAIGVGPTLALVLASSACGLALLRRAGIGTISKLAQRLRNEDQALSVLADGVWQMLAGFLLVVPGFFSSAVGLLLLLPPTRSLLTLWIKIQVRRGGSVIRVVEVDPRPIDPRPGPEARIIEADYVELDPVRLDIRR
jgi:UPF0716 protein FxsA